MVVPLYADGATSELLWIFFARICIEVDVSKELPDKVPLVNERNEEFMQAIIYEFVPLVCKHCCLFGHLDKHCRYGGRVNAKEHEVVQRREWQPKAQEMEVQHVQEEVQLEQDVIVDAINV
ncbi:hypothetical protein LIER_03073 [Lithospermum erythrorhizon]|uniref:Uncharacterized protein n=1 Tax=Lithospermum erythrorhizon TaxID=34254 RepID=A0AAV3NTD0_LITER